MLTAPPRPALPASAYLRTTRATAKQLRRQAGTGNSNTRSLRRCVAAVLRSRASPPHAGPLLQPFGHAHGGGNGRGAQQQRAAAGGGRGVLPLTAAARPYGADDVAAVKHKAMVKGGRGNTFSSAGGGGNFDAFKSAFLLSTRRLPALGLTLRLLQLRARAQAAAAAAA